MTDSASARTDGTAVAPTDAMPMNELGELLQIKILEYGADRVTGTMPVEGNRQPAGLLHGGASAAFAETLGSWNAGYAAPEGKVPVGVELSCTHHRGMRTGTVYGTSTPVHVGRTMATFDIVIADDQGRRVCTARLTCAYLDRTRPPRPTA